MSTLLDLNPIRYDTFGLNSISLLVRWEEEKVFAFDQRKCHARQEAITILYTLGNRKNGREKENEKRDNATNFSFLRMVRRTNKQVNSISLPT